ncbi:hypothetical protein KPSA1B_101942 [Pseudomonas syringae pv. actinidiae]|nr:hypothetical protein KPSA1B_101942 [Pseudomonas syringae pv. actinidiae]
MPFSLNDCAYKNGTKQSSTNRVSVGLAPNFSRWLSGEPRHNVRSPFT